MAPKAHKIERDAASKLTWPNPPGTPLPDPKKLPKKDDGK